MTLTGPNRLGRTFSGHRRLASLVMTVLGLMTVIIIGVHVILDRTIEASLLRGSEEKAKNWVTFFKGEVPDLDRLITTRTATMHHMEIARLAVSYGDVFHFKIFDRSGRPIFVADEATYFTQGTTDINETARRVYQTGISEVAVHDGSGKPNRPDYYTAAYIPALSENGDVLGVIEVCVDETSYLSFVHSTLHWLGVALPAICALLFLIPTIGYLVRSEQKRKRDNAVALLSRFDPLTGVLNRGSFTAEAESAFAGRKSETDAVGVMFVDADRFKDINDLHGHDFGDQFLCHIASAITRSVRETDIVGRLGGDEFVILLPGISDVTLSETAKRMTRAVRQPFEHHGRSVTGHVSVGTHLSVPPEKMAEALHAADLALYHAKLSGRDAVVAYFDDLDIERERRRMIEVALRGAWEGNRLELHFQPLIKLKNREIVSFEALLRLTTDTGEQIPPNEFIPIAEQTGLIHEIGAETIRRAIDIAKTWPEDLFVSVNLSPEQFRRHDLVSRIDSILKEAGFPSHRLELEVTENLLLRDEERVSDQLSRLNALGVSIAMDDFGTGYSSLGYLWKYNFDKLKVDRVFLEGYEFNQDKHRDIIETIILLGHKMGMEVTVEGVETASQDEMLDRLKCDQLQGYLFGRPMSANDAATLLEDGVQDQTVSERKSA
ncbi:putative bifunctional diguanylate cyclase/phosphodiesterase [Aestuariibius sp. 2305UL40-4]|uniref:putative bifunctional diguanylate cyclase/phosphodiesterase n=1 Tax=Aestuariibius violaceus TaxID=3234132 RepID=UPI00345E938E